MRLNPIGFVFRAIPEMWSVYSKAVAGLAILMPAVALPLRSGSSVVFYLLVLASLAGLGWRRPSLAALRRSCREYGYVALALMLPLAALLITAWVRQSPYDAALEKSLRFALTLPILWMLLQIPRDALRHVQWGLMAGALGGAAMVLWIMGWQSHDRDVLISTGAHYNAVSFANIVMLTGLSSFLTLGWQLTRYRRAEAVLKCLVGLIALDAVLISETRSSWMVLPFFVPIALRLWSNVHIRLRWLVAVLLAAVLLTALLAWFEPTLHARIDQGANDIRAFFDGTNRDTSLGIRLQLWYAALYAFAQYPVFGIGGTAEFSELLHAMAAQNLVSPMVAADFGEPHNDYLAALAGFGILGGLSIVLLYAAPGWLFWRRLGHGDRKVKVAAALGALLCASFALYSLSEYMFRNMRMVPVYTVLMAIFLALSRPAPSSSSSAAAHTDSTDS